MPNRILPILVWVLLSLTAGVASAQGSNPQGSDVLQTMWPGSSATLGVDVVPITPELRTHFGAPSHLGVLVGRVAPGSMAAKAGIVVGDVLTRVDTTGITSPHVLRVVIGTKLPGERMTLDVIRDKRLRRLVAVAVEAPVAPRVEPRSRYRWPSDLLDPWTNTPIPRSPWDDAWDGPSERRLRELERRVKQLEQKLDENL